MSIANFLTKGRSLVVLGPRLEISTLERLEMRTDENGCGDIGSDSAVCDDADHHPFPEGRNQSGSRRPSDIYPLPGENEGAARRHTDIARAPTMPLVDMHTTWRRTDICDGPLKSSVRHVNELPVSWKF